MSDTDDMELEWTVLDIVLSASTLLLVMIAPLIIACFCRPVHRRASAKPGGLSESITSLRGPITLLVEELLFLLLLEVAPLPTDTEDLFRPFFWFMVAVTALWLTNNTLSVVGRAFSTPAVLVDSRKGDAATDEVSPILSKALRALVMGLIAALALESAGLSVTPLVTGLGVGGLVVGLALQATLTNMIASAAIVSDRPFEVGDYVDVDGKLGAVESIGLRSTRLRTLDGERVVVPNSQLDSKVVVNKFRSTFTRWVWSMEIMVVDPASIWAFVQETRALIEQFPGLAADLDPYAAVYVKGTTGATVQIEFKLVLEAGPLTDPKKCEALLAAYRMQVETAHGPPHLQSSKSFQKLVETATSAAEALRERSSSETHRMEKSGGPTAISGGGVSVNVSNAAVGSVKVKASWSFWPVYLEFRELFTMRVLSLMARHKLKPVVDFRMQQAVANP